MRYAPIPMLLVAVACGGGDRDVVPGVDGAAPLEWAIAIHGGAGSLREDMDPELEAGLLAALETALRIGVERLDGGASSLDVVEEVVARLEDDPLFNAGRGAVFNAEGGIELDASIMDGRDLSSGAVAGVRYVRNPIRVARDVMERTPHVLLAGEGADRFAVESGHEPVDPSYFHTERRRRALERALERRRGSGEPTRRGGSTVGVVALDREGHLAAGTSTGGLTAKRWGRVGDSPIVGAGTFADDRSCAVSGTGIGEEFIRHGVARAICDEMRLLGRSLDASMRRMIDETLAEDVGGAIGVDARGNLALRFNTESMPRASATSAGRFDVAIFPDSDR